MRDTDPISAPDANDQTTVPVEGEWCDRGPIGMRDKDPVKRHGQVHHQREGHQRRWP